MTDDASLVERRTTSSKVTGAFCRAGVRRVLQAVAVSVLMACASSDASAQSTDQHIATAYKAVETNSPKAMNDISALIELLREVSTLPEQAELIEALRALGDVHGASPPQIKASLKDIVPVVLLEFARGRADGRVRGQALASLRSFEPPADILDQAMEIANSDTSPDRDEMQRQGAALARWRQNPSEADPIDKGRPVDPVARKQALAALASRKVDVSYSALLEAVARGDAGTIGLLSDAGLQFGGVHQPASFQAVMTGLTSACRNDAASPDRIKAVFKVLVDDGFRMDGQGEYGNGLVMHAVQSCSAPVIASLIDLGAKANPRNYQNATPLTLALVGGEWDKVKVLVEHGGGMSKDEVDAMFMELPQDPQQKALVERAIQNGAQ